MTRKIHQTHIFLGITLLTMVSLACGSLQVRIVTPTSDGSFIIAEETQEPTAEMGLSMPVEETPGEPNAEPTEDFSHLWVEYWNPVYNYGLAIPSHWLVETEPVGGFMIAKSYDLAYFQANSIKGNWIGGSAPEGAVKLDFAILEVEIPEQSLEVAIRSTYEQSESVLLAIETTSFGAAEAAIVTSAPSHNLEDKNTHIEIRLSPEIILAVAAYPNAALYSTDVQLILNSLALDRGTPIIKPTTAPHSPLIVQSEISGSATATYATAWYGHIASLPAGDPYKDKVVLLPMGTGEFGIQGSTSEIETQIQSLRDSVGATEYVHLWGVLYCNVDDYNTCQLNIERLEYEGEYTVAISPVDKWVGKIKSTTFNGTSAYAFELSGNVPVRYGIAASNDAVLQSQIEALADSDTLVNVWGEMLVGVPDVNGTRIEVSQLDPPTPGALPSSATCESGYLGSVEEALEFVQYNLEIGNHYPFSYFIGNPFVIGYWQSEGVAIPRDQAYQQLTEQYLPPPYEAIIITDLAEYPDLSGMSVENMWGPDVDVATTIYTKGWGVDGNGEAILVIARCHENSHDAYYWDGMLYAGDGFE